jgi:hypothetical protein
MNARSDPKLKFTKWTEEISSALKRAEERASELDVSVRQKKAQRKAPWEYLCVWFCSFSLWMCAVGFFT